MSQLPGGLSPLPGTSAIDYHRLNGVRFPTQSQNSNNLITTSKQTAKVGGQITITVALDTDFGIGYMHPLLAEQATIQARFQTHFILETPLPFRLISYWTRLAVDFWGRGVYTPRAYFLIPLLNLLPLLVF